MWVKCHAVIELIGKPKEHIEKTMNEYVEAIKKNEAIKVENASIANTERVEGAKGEGMVEELWGTFAELDFDAKNMVTITQFCISYMPSSIEIIEPEENIFTNRQLTEFFNNMQLRLHDLDMVAKQARTEILFLRKNIEGLLKNYIVLLLNGKSLKSEDISKFTGVSKQSIEEFMSRLEEEGLVVSEDGIYKLK